MWDRCDGFDYVSDRQLANVRLSKGKLLSGSNKYRAVVIPKCQLLPLNTLEMLIDLARKGATIIVHGDLPKDVPGLGNLEERRKLLSQSLALLKPIYIEYQGISQAVIGRGRFLIGVHLEEILTFSGIAREPIVDAGVQFIRRIHRHGHHYFLTNLSNHIRKTSG